MVTLVTSTALPRALPVTVMVASPSFCTALNSPSLTSTDTRPLLAFSDSSDASPDCARGAGFFAGVALGAGAGFGAVTAFGATRTLGATGVTTFAPGWTLNSIFPPWAPG